MHPILDAIEAVPREQFVEPSCYDEAYDDLSLPIGYGQSSPSPYVIADMLAALDIGNTHTALHIGTGSGYLSAILAQLARRVYTLEHHAPLHRRAIAQLETLSLHNVTALCKNALNGWETTAPYDRIITTCAVSSVPTCWLEQLKPDGIAIVPVGNMNNQKIMKITRDKHRFHSSVCGESTFDQFMDTNTV